MIAIKGMKEMPSCCADCNMTTCKGKDAPWNYVCSINLKDIDFNETDRAEHCPLVEIVTCKDCKWWDSENNKIGHCNACKHGHYSSTWDIGIYRRTNKDFYCADGERRE